MQSTKRKRLIKLSEKENHSLRKADETKQRQEVSPQRPQKEDALREHYENLAEIGLGYRQPMEMLFNKNHAIFKHLPQKPVCVPDDEF